MLHKDEYWKRFIPNEDSGPCHTYDPPQDSDPGRDYYMYMVFNMTSWDPLLEIYLHNKNSFFYSSKPIVNTMRIDFNYLNLYSTILGTKNPLSIGMLLFYEYTLYVYIYI